MSHAARIALQGLAHAFGAPTQAATFKQVPDDFHVEEDLGFVLSGAGEHLCVLIRKTGISTPQVVRLLARAAGIREADIGYAGLKDKQGVCVQWFSLWLPARSGPSWESLADHGIEVLAEQRNSRKIRRGSHRSNRFSIYLRDVADADARVDEEDLSQRLAVMAARGVPNYFGEQRFGHENSNVAMAASMFAGQLRVARGFKRGMLISAARSQLFNAVLSRRVQEQTWDRYVAGDVMNLQGSDSVFMPTQWDDTLQRRLEEFDIHPTGPLWGAGELHSQAMVRELELLGVEDNRDLCKGLEAVGLQQARRSLRLRVQGLEWKMESPGELSLHFSLPPGAYATAVLRELVMLR